ncbi:oxalate/formate MFS antiporter [Paraburkholderia silviterrae]|uniref:Oxalate/formate MFS antiporter n=1 Tax=Paraburkholderia silviterrae TaxID=2528715 RepID=A0A4R5M981_9BURK|nr:oxalate/formate MFS antiporter [Paraburkholderia silviterrae]TDG22764.1 oxalate/formate MFS antiporter [Paraburkholderia silviterrae]
MTNEAASPATGILGNRWFQLFLGILCMGLVTNLQYGWTLFVKPMHETMKWSEAGIQVAFTVFVLVETWLIPIEGWLVDRYGPRPVAAAGGLLIALAWTLNGFAATLPELYIGSAIAGVGAGCVYGTCVGNALKWFPDRRGFASGLTAAGYGVGAALTVIPIANSIASNGYKATFIRFALILGFSVFVIALFMRRPPHSLASRKRAGVAGDIDREYSPAQVVRTPVFWCLYVVLTLVCAGGLLASAQIAPIAKDFGIASKPILFIGATLPLLTLTMTIDNIVNGLTRPLSGLLSDHIGRENTMLIVFIGQGIALSGLVLFGRNPYAFLIFAPMVFLCYAELYAISSAMAGDIFGTRHVTANSGMLYTTKGIAALLVPLGSVITVATGSWNTVFLGCGVASIAMGFVAKFVLEPMRIRFVNHGGEKPAGQLAHAARCKSEPTV